MIADYQETHRAVVRLNFAARYAVRHLIISGFIVGGAALLVFLLWFPAPYHLISGGRELFLLLVCVDMICGPLMTFIVANPQKKRNFFFFDVSIVVTIQLMALVYGLQTAYVARPLYLVHEVDRFRVISTADYNDDADVHKAFTGLSPSLRPGWWKKPVQVGIREPLSGEERAKILMESASGGRDYSQRPEFYIPYDEKYRAKVLARARPLRDFLQRNPSKIGEIKALIRESEIDLVGLKFLPVVHRKDWIAILDDSAQILGFVEGDGFV